jgi:hypothetical protein
MSYLGNNTLPFDPSRTSGRPRDAERFNGDGSNTAFQLSVSISNPTDLEVFVENVQQEPITAYDAFGRTLTFSEAPPSGTNNIYVIYRNTVSDVHASIPDGSITFSKLANNIRLFTTDNFTGDGGTTTFNLSSDVADANTLMVAVDGVFQRAPIHYTASNSTITFSSAPPATSNVHVRHLGFRTTQTVTALPANITISQPVLQSPTVTGNVLIASDGDTTLTIQSITGSGQSPSIRLQRGTYGTDAFNDIRVYNTLGRFHVDNIDSSENATNCLIASPGGIALQGATAATSGVGIKFPASQDPSSDANTLDDYEEGTWTPSYESAGISAVTYGTGRNGYYTKVGRLVTVTINIMTSAVTVTNGSNVVTISGLPFTASSATESGNAITIAEAARWTSNPPSGGIIARTSTSIILYRTYFTTADDAVQNTVSDMGTVAGNKNILRLTATYFTD